MDIRNLRELMEIDVNDLKILQHRELKSHVIRVLQDVTKLVKEEKYEELIDQLAYSPAGDGYGEYNHYINFSYYQNRQVDIEQIVYELNNLKLQIDEENF